MGAIAAVNMIGRRLTMLRHAQAYAARAGQHDFERPLDPTGLQQLRTRAPAFAAATADFPVDRCLYSPALRTATTAAAFIAAVGLPAEAATPEPSLFEIELPALLDLLRRVPQTTGHLLVVGHNPTLSMLAWRLSPDAPRGGLSPADHVTVTLPGEWWELR